MVKKVFAAVCLSAFGLIAGLVAIEVLFRVAEKRITQAPSWSDRPPFYFQDERSPTLKDHAYSDEKPEDTFRIAVVGDSYSFAPFMQFTDAFPKVLERMLNLNDVPTKTEVINFGVPGYSTSHEIEEVQTAIKMGSDLVILQITLNDPELKPYRPTGIREFGRFGLYEPSEFEKRVFPYWKSFKFAKERLHNNKTREEYIKYFMDLFSNPRTRSSFEASVKKIARLSKRSSTPLIAVVFPLFGVPLDDEYPFHSLHEQVGALLSSLDVPTLDLFSPYKGIPLDRLQVIPGGDRHPNEIAHRMAAESIYTFLAENNVIPDDLKIRRRFTGRTQIVKETPFVD